LVSDDTDVTFGECLKGATKNQNLTGFKNLLGLSPWELNNPTPSTHSIAILSEAVKEFKHGSFIGAFDQSGLCFGIS